MRFVQPQGSRKEPLEKRGQGLPRYARLRRRGEILAVQRHGRSARSPHVTAVFRLNELGCRRLGVTVSSKVGKAVARNKVKRWFREVFRRHEHELPAGMDVILIARPGSREVGYEGIETEVVGLFAKLAEMEEKGKGRFSRFSNEEEER